MRSKADRDRLSRSCRCRVVLLVGTPRNDHQVSIGQGRCNAFDSSQGARIQTSHSSLVVRITGIAFGWIGSTIAFGVVVRKPPTSPKVPLTLDSPYAILVGEPKSDVPP